jgi:hypothetical protein
MLEEKEIIEFSFPEENFIIYCEDGIWKAKHNDEDLFEEELIIEDSKQGILFLEESMDLFGVYVLCLDHFKKLKEISGDK